MQFSSDKEAVDYFIGKFEALKQEIARYRRYGGALSLILFDIDHFKQINDTYGHQTGDKVLVELACAALELVETYLVLEPSATGPS